MGNRADMPMVAREPGSHQTAVLRSGHASTFGRSSPPDGLLPSGGSAPGPAPAPHRALALDALRLRRGLRDPVHRPEPWDDAAFAREVELIRCHLAPLRNRRSLTASFGREAFQSLEFEPPAVLPLGPIRAAYAIRWLELGSGGTLPAWTQLLAIDPARLQASLESRAQVSANHFLGHGRRVVAAHDGREELLASDYGKLTRLDCPHGGRPRDVTDQRHLAE